MQPFSSEMLPLTAPVYSREILGRHIVAHANPAVHSIRSLNRRATVHDYFAVDRVQSTRNDSILSDRDTPIDRSCARRLLTIRDLDALVDGSGKCGN
jgi:hypothetical protein